ncbi:MAG: hypothetical protein BRD46_03445 [Bacteroidetes bacterium QS_8_68_15]|nr:MAG: hypothetical protein BRD46_03445 [Bacteroidetes bacterium QS_8_68_15]
MARSSPSGGSSGASAGDPSGDDPAGDPARSDSSDAPEEPAGRSSASEPTASSEGDDRETDERERTRRRLLAAIGQLYALAQALTDSEHAARHLVEATYARAADALATGDAPMLAARPHHDDHGGEEDDDARGRDASDAARAWLFALLVETARDTPPGEEAGPFEGDADEEETASDDEASSSSGHHIRRRAQERFLRRTLPSAFASLAPGRRLLLTLCDVEALSFAEAARVAGLSDASDARERHTDARAELRDALRQMAPRPERPFLDDDALPAGRLRAALRRMAERDLTAPPPALRPAARHALQRPSRGAPSSSGERDAASSSGALAADRPARAPSDDTDEAPSTWRRRLPRLLVTLLLIAGAGAFGYVTTTVLKGTAETSVTALAAERASEVTVRLRTDRPERAEQFVRDELGRRLSAPRIEGASLRGVGLAEVTPDERVPVFLFRDAASERPVAAYAYDYALLDRAGERLRLAPRLRRQLEKEGRFAAEEVSDQRVLLWRHRDDIFAVVTARPDSLRQRIAV